LNILDLPIPLNILDLPIPWNILDLPIPLNILLFKLCTGIYLNVENTILSFVAILQTQKKGDIR